MNRGHVFGNMTEVKAELSPLIMELSPSCSASAMPFLAVQDDLGNRTIVCTRESGLSGG